MYTNSCMVGENDNEDDCICEVKFYLIVTLLSPKHTLFS